jgi:uncharacterized membrane protein YdjX (TVP38/TMEM64 family)
VKPGVGKKLAIAGAILLLLILVKAFGLDQYLTLSFLKAQQACFAALSATNPLMVPGAYALISIAVTTLSLPGSEVMTLAGGALSGILSPRLPLAAKKPVNLYRGAGKTPGEHQGNL